MTKYIIKSKKIEEGRYNHEVYGEGGKKLDSDRNLRINNSSVKDFLHHYSMSIVPFMRVTKIDNLELKVEADIK